MQGDTWGTVDTWGTGQLFEERATLLLHYYCLLCYCSRQAYAFPTGQGRRSRVLPLRFQGGRGSLHLPDLRSGFDRGRAFYQAHALLSGFQRHSRFNLCADVQYNMRLGSLDFENVVQGDIMREE